MQVKSSAQLEEEFPSYSLDDIVFLFGDVVRPMRLILKHNDPTECYVLYPPAAPMQDIFNLVEAPSWVGAHMQLGLHRPHASIFLIVSKLLQDKALEEGEEYECIPIKPLDPEVLGSTQLSKKGKNLLLLMPC